MSQSVSKIPLKEDNNYKQGKTGAETMKKMGPSSGKAKGNAGTGGGIVSPTKGLKK
jgi:hypothetical protein